MRPDHWHIPFSHTGAQGFGVIEGLRGHTTGYAVPTYVIDAPDGGGKIPLLPDYMVQRQGDNLLLRNYEGRIYRYPDAHAAAAAQYGGTCDVSF